MRNRVAQQINWTFVDWLSSRLDNAAGAPSNLASAAESLAPS